MQSYFTNLFRLNLWEEESQSLWSESRQEAREANALLQVSNNSQLIFPRNGKILNQIYDNDILMSTAEIACSQKQLAFFDRDGNGLTGAVLEAALKNQEKIQKNSIWSWT